MDEIDEDITTVTPGTGFSVETEVYSGPLDLLIDLIEKRKLLVNDISLASVTDDYMAYVARFENNPLREMADFIVLASTLLLLKSKSLLPVLELTESEEENIESLEQRLKYYQIFRSIGKKIESIFGKQVSYSKRFVTNSTPLFVTDHLTTAPALHNAMADVLRNLPRKVAKPKVQVRKVVSLETMISRLRERVEKQFSCNFKDFTGGGTERATVIVGFLAVLEMVKQGFVIVRQNAHFHDIEIERDHNTTPHYE